MFEHTKCTGLLILSMWCSIIFTIGILMTSDSSTIYYCTPLRCQVVSLLLNEKSLERKHIENGWNNHLFNSHYVLSHQFKTSTVTLVLHMLGMKEMLLDAFQKNELGDEVDVIDTFYKSLKFASTTPIFGPMQQSARSTKLGTTMVRYNLKTMYGMAYN